MTFKGLNDWIAIFQGGKQTDSSGKEHDGDVLIDKALANFNASRHEPPIVIGHPEHDAPAWGWVEGLKKQGNTLYAKFKQVQPEFAQMVGKGLFKKRSAAFYPDGTLRHVGFLGAMPPAVKGLPDVAFAEGDAASFEFNEDLRAAGIPTAEETLTTTSDKEDKKMTFKEKVAAFFNELLAKMPDDGPAAQASSTAAATVEGKFSEADIEKAKQEAARLERDKVTAEFAEQARKNRREALKSEISAFCEQLINQGKILPATVKFGLPEILFALSESENQIEFGETKEKATAYDRMKALLENANPLVSFGEVATREKDAGVQTGQAGLKLAALVDAKMKSDKALTHSAAFAEAQRENPDLAREYMAELQGN